MHVWTFVINKADNNDDNNNNKNPQLGSLLLSTALPINWKDRNFSFCGYSSSGSNIENILSLKVGEQSFCVRIFIGNTKFIFPVIFVKFVTAYSLSISYLYRYIWSGALFHK